MQHRSRVSWNDDSAWLRGSGGCAHSSAWLRGSRGRVQSLLAAWRRRNQARLGGAAVPNIFNVKCTRIVTFEIWGARSGLCKVRCWSFNCSHFSALLHRNKIALLGIGEGHNLVVFRASGTALFKASRRAIQNHRCENTFCSRKLRYISGMTWARPLPALTTAFTDRGGLIRFCLEQRHRRVSHFGIKLCDVFARMALVNIFWYWNFPIGFHLFAHGYHFIASKDFAQSRTRRPFQRWFGLYGDTKMASATLRVTAWIFWDCCY